MDISSTTVDNQGVNDTDKPKSDSKKASLAGFQYTALASGEMATPTSPIPAERASGEIARKGTPVVITRAESASPKIAPCRWAYPEKDNGKQIIRTMKKRNGYNIGLFGLMVVKLRTYNEFVKLLASLLIR